MEEMKWYIFNEEDDPLCWVDGNKAPALQFDTQTDAELFLISVQKIYETYYNDAHIKECIFFYDDGKFNASGYVAVKNETTGEVELAKWRIDKEGE